MPFNGYVIMLLRKKIPLSGIFCVDKFQVMEYNPKCNTIVWNFLKEVKIMYRVLIGKMAESNILQKDLATLLGITEKAFSQKLNGKTKFTLDQAIVIRDNVAPAMSIDELFSVRK